MKISTAIFIVLSLASHTQASELPDWLVKKFPVKTSFSSTPEKNNVNDEILVLNNGLISRTFWTFPSFHTSDFFSYEKDSSLLRAFAPEAVIGINGKSYNIGGVLSSVPRAYLNRTNLLSQLSPDPNAFQFVSWKIDNISAPYPYKPARGAPSDIVWPPAGTHLQLEFKAPSSAPDEVKGIIVTVNYELYDGIPLLSKWLSVESNSLDTVKVSFEAVEILHVNQQWSELGDYKWFHVENNEPHGNQVVWGKDPNATDLFGAFVPMVVCNYSQEFTVNLKGADQIETFKVLELVTATSDYERQTLAQRKMLRLLAPHTQENPIYFHVTNDSLVVFKEVIDQMSEVGFEMLLWSFGCGWNLETNGTDWLNQMKEMIGYANSKGIEVGGYDLVALTRHVDDSLAALDVNGHNEGNACFASEWYDYLLQKVVNLVKEANLTVLESDGPYGGYSCSSEDHKYHENAADSVFYQNRKQGEFFKILRTMGVYINQPDNYFYQGGSKTGLGYNEMQYTLPRWMDLSVSRQGMFDDTFKLIPSVGWMFLPLLPYHEGGPEAIFEPLNQHLKEYEWGLAQYMGAGVAACYRGLRLYDTDETKAVVKKWVDFYKRYRSILNADILHVRRGDMQSFDAFMHVDPHQEDIKALAMIFNPTSENIHKTLTLNLYYTGIEKSATVAFEDENPVKVNLDRAFEVNVPLSMKPESFTWLVVRLSD